MTKQQVKGAYEEAEGFVVTTIKVAIVTLPVAAAMELGLRDIAPEHALAMTLVAASFLAGTHWLRRA